MDYFQGVVTDYLVADRAIFVNSELMIQLDENELKKGRHWFCDAAAVNVRKKTLFLCEVTYSKSMSALSKRLLAWDANWEELRRALERDCGIPISWTIQPWAFIPEDFCEALKSRITLLDSDERDGNAMPYPQITLLESVVPWKYETEDRKDTAFEDKI